MIKAKIFTLNMLAKLGELAVSLLGFLPTKPERSNPESIQVQVKDLEGSAVQDFNEKEEGLVNTFDECNTVIVANSELFSAPDNVISQGIKEQIPNIDDLEDAEGFVEELIEASKDVQQSKGEAESEKCDLSIDELGCSTRLINSLYRAGIRKISDLHGKTAEDLLRIKDFGVRSLNELSDALHAFGYSDRSGKWMILDEDEYTESDRRDTETFALPRRDLPEIFYGSTITNPDAMNFEYVAEQTSRIIDEFVCSFNSCDIQGFGRRLLKLADQFNGVNGLEAVLIELDTASSCYLYPSSYKQEEIFRLNVSRLLLLSSILNRRYLRDDAAGLLRNVRKQCEHVQDSPLHLFYRLVAGETLQQIGGSLALPLSRERVRQKVDQVSRIFLLKTRTFIDEVNGYLDSALNNNLVSYYASDKSNSLDSLCFDSLRVEMESTTLRERLEIVERRLGHIPTQEYDYQYEQIRSGLVAVGSGYWNDIQRLSQYLYRHAIADGNPKLMPKQVYLPDSVRGAVTRFGGQSYVANKIGLDYQGQLVADGPGGRAYWDHERVDQLLSRIKEYFKLASVDEITKESVRYYFEWSGDEEIKNKKINSLFAALTRLDIGLAEAKDDELTTLIVNSNASSIGEPELILQPSDDAICEKPSVVQDFSFDTAVAAKMRMQDQELKSELDQIFMDEPEDDQLCESDAKALSDSSRAAGLDIPAIVNLFRADMTDDLILISVLKVYADNQNVMYASFVDKLNELSIAKCGENLLEEEDSTKLYVNPLALDNLIKLAIE